MQRDFFIGGISKLIEQSISGRAAKNLKRKEALCVPLPLCAFA